MRINLSWVPNTITMGNLVFGFLSIVYSSNMRIENHFQIAAIMILFAAVFDGFDGYIARSLGVTSSIGRELDSLADLVAFGIAPGYLFYQMYLEELNFSLGTGEVYYGMIIAAIFPICAAFRLARYNVQNSGSGFQGLPSPVAGIAIALLPLIQIDLHIHVIYPILLFIFIALLMVSTIQYSKPQATFLKSLRGVRLILAILLIVAVIVFFKKWAMVIFLLLYLISGLVSFVIHLIQVMRL